jgi:hypothetical protein
LKIKSNVCNRKRLYLENINREEYWSKQNRQDVKPACFEKTMICFQSIQY